MNATRFLFVILAASGMMFTSPPAQAHCDSLDGPVAKAALKALETGNVNPVLAFAPATAEPEIIRSFEQSRKVRVLGADARALADQSFLETVIRLHRAGEGAAFTGLKPAGLDYGPVIPAAEHAVETGDLTEVQAVLVREIEHALQDRIAHVRALQDSTVEPVGANGVPGARERISAELGFITFAEALHQATLGKGAEQHVD